MLALIHKEAHTETHTHKRGPQFDSKATGDAPKWSLSYSSCIVCFQDTSCRNDIGLQGLSALTAVHNVE